MMSKDHNDCVVTVTIEIGHTANFLKEPSPDGFTHDWTVFVRGKDGSKIEHFVEKVVFKLHKTFKCPTRALYQPPYKVNESGYAGFILPIEIHFKNKQSPRKISFTYDLFLNAKDQPPINNFRYEKLKFSNPTPEFKAKLIKAGGIQLGGDSEQQSLPYVLGSPVKSETKKSNKKLKEGSQEKKKKKHKRPREVSPVPSLPSLSPSSSSEDEKEEKNSSLHHSAISKKEKEPAKKEWVSLSNARSESSSSLHQNKSKSRNDSQSTPSKDKAEKETPPKKHKSEDRDKERERHSSSHKSSKEKKSKESSSSHSQYSQKLPKDSTELKRSQESPPLLNKSSSSSSAEKKSSSSSSHGENKDKHSSLSREGSLSHHKEKHCSHKSKEMSSSKPKHSSSHKDKDSLEQTSGKKHDQSDKKSKEKDKSEKKKNKRSSEEISGSSGSSEVVERKKSKPSPQTIEDSKSIKPKSSQSKNKDSVDSKHNIQKDVKEVKVKESSPKSKDKELVVKREKSELSTIPKKHKHDKDRDKYADRSKPVKEKHREAPAKELNAISKRDIKKEETPVKSEALLHTEHLAMTADFQPRLLVSPLKSDLSSDEDSSTEEKFEPKQKYKLKRLVSNSSMNSIDLNSSQSKVDQKQNDKLVSGLTDSDSESDDKETLLSPKEKSPRREADTDRNKKRHKTDTSSSSEVLPVKKYKGEKKLSSNTKQRKDSTAHDLPERDEENLENVEDNLIEFEQNKKKPSVHQGLDILAPNGFSVHELLEINEKIQKAFDNTKVLEKLVVLVGETEEFQLDDKSFNFDICSLNTNVVKKIQTLLKEH